MKKYKQGIKEGKRGEKKPHTHTHNTHKHTYTHREEDKINHSTSQNSTATVFTKIIINQIN